MLAALQIILNTEAIRLQNAGDLCRDSGTGELMMMSYTSGAAWITVVPNPDDLTEDRLESQLWAYYSNMVWVAGSDSHEYKDGLATRLGSSTRAGRKRLSLRC